MGDLSKHFSRHEFACKCGCGFADISQKLIELLEIIRKQFGGPIIINSGCRCKKYNRKVGGSRTSQHILGLAADIVVHCWTDDHHGHTVIQDIVSSKIVAQFVETQLKCITYKSAKPRIVDGEMTTIGSDPKWKKTGGIIVYQNFVHVDIRAGRAYRRGLK